MTSTSNQNGSEVMQKAITQLVEPRDLDADTITAAMHTLMAGLATPAQIGSFMTALRMKGETVTEITACARVMRELVTPVHIKNRKHLVDIVGTGGTGTDLFNISTASAFVAACAGCTVAKHGSRAASSKSGSADVLEAAGVRLDLSPEQVTRCIEQLGIGFLFAMNHHNAMKHAVGPRRELGLRTMFNLLGPLTNPANAPHQVLGVFARAWQRPVAEALRELGSEHVLVVHSEDGLDEISLAAPTWIVELHNGKIVEYSASPEDFSLSRQSLAGFKVNSARESLALIKTALTNCHSAAADIVALNAGAAIYAANVCATLPQGVEMARDILGSGLAWEKLQELAQFTQMLE